MFGYDAFRGPQEAIVNHVCAGGDALVLMPTGGGKSLCYQIPAIARQRAGRGVTVVISPLIALMQDQCERLTALGVPAVQLHSHLDAATLRQRTHPLLGHAGGEVAGAAAVEPLGLPIGDFHIDNVEEHLVAVLAEANAFYTSKGE